MIRTLDMPEYLDRVNEMAIDTRTRVEAYQQEQEDAHKKRLEMWERDELARLQAKYHPKEQTDDVHESARPIDRRVRSSLSKWSVLTARPSYSSSGSGTCWGSISGRSKRSVHSSAFIACAPDLLARCPDWMQWCRYRSGHNRSER